MEPLILIVEDETVIRSALQKLLERHEYDVSEAGAVDEALDKFDLGSFDLIISEIKLESLRPQDKITPTGDSFKNKGQTWK